jgi:hypothetical protein
MSMKRMMKTRWLSAEEVVLDPWRFLRGLGM